MTLKSTEPITKERWLELVRRFLEESKTPEQWLDRFRELMKCGYRPKK